MNKKIYLDYNATTPVDPEVRSAMLPYLGEEFGNPSSLHWAGMRARKALGTAREKIAESLSCEDGEIYFTSGGTESINLALKGILYPFSKKSGHVVTSQVEHHAVLKPLKTLEEEGFIEVTRLGVDASGEIDLNEFDDALKENTSLVSMMFVNNETGNIYPIEKMSAMARKKNIPFHVDAVQALGKIPVDLSRLSVDLLSFSSHKIYGPKGVGGLYIRKGCRLHPMIEGGAQEGEKRAGTQNLPGIVGLGVAVQKIKTGDDNERIQKLRDTLEKGIQKIPQVLIHGSRHRVANTLNVSFEGVESEAILIALDQEGIAVSSGSACASGSLQPSHVLIAMGQSEKQAKGSVRFSLGRWTKEEDIEYTLERLPKIVERLRS